MSLSKIIIQPQQRQEEIIRSHSWQYGQGETTVNVGLEAGRRDDLPMTSNHRHVYVSAPKYSFYKEYEARMESFKDWPRKYFTQTPHSMATSGLFYTGCNDRVKCFQCGVVIEKWKQNSDPGVEHLMRSPDCPHVKCVNASNYLQNDQLNSNNRTSSYSDKNVTQSAVNHCPSPLDFNSKPLQTVLEMGFSKDSVKQVVTESNKHKVEDIIEAVLQLDMKQNDVIRNKPTIRNYDVSNLLKEKSELPSNDELKLSAQMSVEQNFNHNYSPNKEMSEDTDEESSTDDSVIMKAKKDNLRLKRQRMCRRCGEQEAVMLCLPCGHIASCVTCTDKTSTCFVCAAKILGTVRTYLA